MSDKPTRDAMVKCYIEAGWNKCVATDFVMILYKKHPEWFASEPDPLEEFFEFLGEVRENCGGYCATCPTRIRCLTACDKLRAYVAKKYRIIAELRRKAGEK